MIPNTTPTPNIIFNGLMRKMNDTEFRIVMLVVRATLGWEADKETGMRKVEDWISSRQLREKTGRESVAISKAIDHCINEGWIEARDKKGNLLNTKGKRKGKNIYFRLGKAILLTSGDEQVIVKYSRDLTSSETANVENAKAKSEYYKRKTIQNKDQTKIDNYKNLSHKEVPVKTFTPNSREEDICHQIAQKLGEENMGFMLWALKKYGLNKIERVWGVIRETKDINNPRKYFNKLIREK